MVAINKFSIFWWTFLLKNENAQTIKVALENFIIISKGASSTDTDDGKKSIHKLFNNFLELKQVER